MKQHTIIGANILKSIDELNNAIDGVKYHHERYDGKGYPEGLEGDKLPVISAIIAVADAYDAMISDRPYRKAYPKGKAIVIVKEGSGTQFDPKIVRAFLKIIENRKRL